MKQILLLIISSALFFCGCGGEETVEEIIARADTEIQEYLDSNGLTAVKTPDGLYIVIENEGSSEKPDLADTISIIYKGYDADGNVFDQTTDPIEFPLNGLIPGWQIGIPYFGKGGNGMLFVPPQLAYGSRDPSNDNFIIFDIELVNF